MNLFFAQRLRRADATEEKASELMNVSQVVKLVAFFFFV